MFARGFLSLHRAALSASRKNSANSNYSRTYATPRGRGCTGVLVRPLPQLLSFPYLRKNRGVHTPKNVGAPTFSLSFLPIPTHGPLAFQSFAHSFIFHITRIRCIFRSMRTLVQKQGVPLPVIPVPLALITWKPLLAGHGSPAPGHFSHSPPIHNPVTPPSPIVLRVLSQCSPVRGPTQTPCLPLSHRVRYTSTDAIRSARCLHETGTDH